MLRARTIRYRREPAVLDVMAMSKTLELVGHYGKPSAVCRSGSSHIPMIGGPDRCTRKPTTVPAGNRNSSRLQRSICLASASSSLPLRTTFRATGAGRRPRYHEASALSLDGRKFEQVGQLHQLGQRLRLHLFHDMGALHFDGRFRGSKRGRNLLIEQASHDLAVYVEFARAQRGAPLSQDLQFRNITSPLCARASCKSRPLGPGMSTSSTMHPKFSVRHGEEEFRAGAICADLEASCTQQVAGCSPDDFLVIDYVYDGWWTGHGRSPRGLGWIPCGLFAPRRPATQT